MIHLTVSFVNRYFLSNKKKTNINFAISLLPSPVSCLLSLVFLLPSPVLSPVSRILPHVSHLLFLVSCLLSLVSRRLAIIVTSESLLKSVDHLIGVIVTKRVNQFYTIDPTSK